MTITNKKKEFRKNLHTLIADVLINDKRFSKILNEFEKENPGYYAMVESRAKFKKRKPNNG